MLEKSSQPAQGTDVKTEAGTDPVATAEAPVKSKKTLTQEEQEVATEEDQHKDEVAVESPRSEPNGQPLQAAPEQAPRTLRSEKEPLAEKEPGSHVRRYSTKPSGAPKVENPTAVSPLQQRVPSQQPPKVQDKVVGSEQQQPPKVEQPVSPAVKTPQEKKAAPSQSQAQQRQATPSRTPGINAQAPQSQAEQRPAPSRTPEQRPSLL